MNRLKIVFARFLLVCWILTTVGFAVGLIGSVFEWDLECIAAAFIIPAICYALIVGLSFIFLGVVKPKDLINIFKP